MVMHNNGSIPTSSDDEFSSSSISFEPIEGESPAQCHDPPPVVSYDSLQHSLQDLKSENVRLKEETQRLRIENERLQLIASLQDEGNEDYSSIQRQAEETGGYGVTRESGALENVSSGLANVSRERLKRKKKTPLQSNRYGSARPSSLVFSSNSQMKGFTEPIHYRGQFLSLAAVAMAVVLKVLYLTSPNSSTRIYEEGVNNTNNLMDMTERANAAKGFNEKKELSSNASGTNEFDDDECPEKKDLRRVVTDMEKRLNLLEKIASKPSLSVSCSHSLALTADGIMDAWGDNSYYQTDIPNSILMGGVDAISAGCGFSVALTKRGTVLAWGLSDQGQTSLPPELSVSRAVMAVSAGNAHGLALLANGRVVGWGWDKYGQATVPSILDRVKAVSAGVKHSLALLHDGTVVGWGDNSHGQAMVPASLRNVKSIAAGKYHSLALTSGGAVVAWGLRKEMTSVPQNLPPVQSIAVGLEHSLAILRNGSVVAWGNNYHGQIDVPPDLDGANAIAAGEYHSLAMKADGSIVGWGWNKGGQSAMIPEGLGWPADEI